MCLRGGSGRLEDETFRQFLDLPHQKPGRTGRNDFSATTQWAPMTASPHTGTGGQVDEGGHACAGTSGVEAWGGGVGGERCCPAHLSSGPQVSPGITPRGVLCLGSCVGVHLASCACWPAGFSSSSPVFLRQRLCH